MYRVSRFTRLTLVGSKGRTMMLLAQKSKLVVQGRRRRKHELAAMPTPNVERMEVEERKEDKDNGEHGS